MEKKNQVPEFRASTPVMFSDIIILEFNKSESFTTMLLLKQDDIKRNQIKTLNNSLPTNYTLKLIFVTFEKDLTNICNWGSKRLHLIQGYFSEISI